MPRLPIAEMRSIRYKEIAEILRHGIRRGTYGPGQVLPSEAELGRMHEASRVTVRKALEELRADGLVESRQGFGWMVAAEPVVQHLDTLVTIERRLAETGRPHRRRVLEFRFVDAPTSVAPVLGPRVLEVRRLSLVDGSPFARVTVWCRDDLAADISHADVSERSFYDLPAVRAAGATQTIGAELMNSEDASLLDVPEASAALVVRRTSFDREGHPILMAEHVFPGHLTEFVAQLPRPGLPAQLPSTLDRPGLRLVEGG